MEYFDRLIKLRQIVLNHLPDNFQIYPEILMNQKVAKILDILL